MKRTSLLASLFGLVFLLSMITVNIPPAAAAGTISVEPDKITGDVGETFTVDIIVGGLTSYCYSYQIYATYDSSIIDVTRWWEGPFLKGNPALTLQSYFSYNDTDGYAAPNWLKLYDKNNGTYSDFQYSERDGYYGLYKFGVDPKSTDSVIKKVDMKMRYSANASSSGDQYRIVYYTGTPSSPGGIQRTLVDWTSAATTLGTYVWEDTTAPTADGWQWNEDVDGLCVSVETDMVGGDASAHFYWYEFWLTIVYEVPTTTVTNSGTGWIAMGGTIIGPYDGTRGTGLLLTMEFIINSMGNTVININSVPDWTYVNTKTGSEISTTKENGLFFEPWPEDLHPDGIIDIRDLAIVGVNYGVTGGVPVEQVASPSAYIDGGTPWTNPANAFSSNDVYANTPKGGEETYHNYGFGTASWLSVTTVEVGVEGYSEGGEQIDIEVSWDGGTNWSPSSHTLVFGLSDALTWIDVTSDHAWVPSDLTDGNFRVRGTVTAVGGFKPTYVDWLPVRVNVIGAPEGDVNGDGDVDIVDLAMVAVKYMTIYL